MTYKLIREPRVGLRYKYLGEGPLYQKLVKILTYDKKSYFANVMLCDSWGLDTGVVVDRVPVAKLDL